MRHAKSSWAQPELTDFARPLSRRGRDTCPRICALMLAHKIEPDTVLCSAARRARETLQAILPSLHRDVTITIERRLYLADAAKLLARMRELDERCRAVMLIGHNPALQDLALQLNGDGDPQDLARLKAKFPTGAIAHLTYSRRRWRDLAAGKACLAAILDPRKAHVTE